MDLKEFERVYSMLTELEPHIKEMKGKAPDFLRDQLERAEKWQAEMFLSPKQLQWIESLYEEHCGAKPEPSEDDADEDELGDEIPY